MELAADAIAGLSILGEKSKLPDAAFKATVIAAAHSLLHPEEPTGLLEADAVNKPGTSSTNVKAAFSGLATCLAEAARADLDQEGLQSALEDVRVEGARAEYVGKAYSKRRDELRAMLRRTAAGTGLSHVVDVSWRLDFNLKNNHKDRASEPQYVVNFKTVEVGGGTKDVLVSCTLAQMHDLVRKLKNACKSCEKLSA